MPSLTTRSGGAGGISLLNYDPDIYDLNTSVPEDTLLMHVDFSDISTLWQDLSKSTQVASDGDPIAYVDNKGASNLIPGMSVMDEQSLTESAPKYETTTTYNGLPCAEFVTSGLTANNYLVADKYVNKNVKGITGYIVVKTISANAGYVYNLMDLMDVSLMYHGDNAQAQIYASMGTVMTYDNTLGLNSLHCTTISSNRERSAPLHHGNHRYFKNNVKETPTQHNYGQTVSGEDYGSTHTSDFNLFALGDYTSIGFSSLNPLNAITRHICELKVFTSNHDSTRRATEYATLQTKWGI